MNPVPSSTFTLSDTHDPDGHAWKLLSTLPADQTGSGPHPMKSRVVDDDDDGSGRMEFPIAARVGPMACLVWERVRGDEVREGAKPMASLVAMRPTRREELFMVMVKK